MRNKIKKYIRKWERQGYEDGIPEQAPFVLEQLGKVPSYRLICQAILKNDTQLKLLGYNREECDSYRILKRIELIERGVIKPSKQRELFNECL